MKKLLIDGTTRKISKDKIVASKGEVSWNLDIIKMI